MEDRQRKHLENTRDRFDELNNLLSSSEVLKDMNLFRDYSKEVSGIKPIVDLFVQFEDLEKEYHDVNELLADQDREVKELAQAETQRLGEELRQQEEMILAALLGKNDEDDRNVFLEIRAGAGGNEAAIFGGDLLGMYQRFADHRGWSCDIISLSDSDQGGYKQAVLYIKGKEVFGELKFESGTHRVQRVPKTEANGRLHTSTCTVAILPEASGDVDIQINKADLRIDTYRASGAGGQHVNKTDSAVRITHIPTGLVVECQDERSQHRNKEKAMAILQAKMLDAEQQKQVKETSQLRKSLVGTGDRAEKVRTYNYPQNRVTDHRIGLTLHALDSIILGDLSALVEALKTEEKSLIASGAEV